MKLCIAVVALIGLVGAHHIPEPHYHLGKRWEQPISARSLDQLSPWTFYPTKENAFQRYYPAKDYEFQRYYPTRDFEFQRYYPTRDFEFQRYYPTRDYEFQRYYPTRDYEFQRYYPTRDYEFQRYYPTRDYEFQRYFPWWRESNRMPIREFVYSPEYVSYLDANRYLVPYVAEDARYPIKEHIVEKVPDVIVQKEIIEKVPSMSTILINKELNAKPVIEEQIVEKTVPATVGQYIINKEIQEPVKTYTTQEYIKKYPTLSNIEALKKIKQTTVSGAGPYSLTHEAEETQKYPTLKKVLLNQDQHEEVMNIERLSREKVAQINNQQLENMNSNIDSKTIEMSPF